MILRRLELSPFAGTRNGRYPLEPGLNVISGPNEAGKSTLVTALWSALFLPVNLYKRDHERFVEPCLPLSGGDSIRIALNFEVHGKTYELRKTWGQTPSAELAMPGGARISDPEQVDGELMALLGLGQGTVEHVLFANQASLGSSLERIGLEGVGRDELADRLRQAVFETDGVSLDRLAEAIAVRKKRYFDHWDREAERPEKNRGIDDPWKKEVGRILGAWYVREGLRAELEAADQYERDLGEVNERLQKLSREREELKTFLDAHNASVSDAEQRALLEARLVNVTEKESSLRKLSQEWPAAIERATGLTRQLEDLAEKGKELSTKLADAKKHEQGQALRSQRKKAEDIDGALSKARAGIAELPAVTRRILQELEDAHRAIEQRKQLLNRGDITLTFTPRKAVSLEITEGASPAREVDLKEDAPLSLEGGARYLLSHPEWILEVCQGDGEHQATPAQLQDATRALDGRFAALKVPDLDAARQAHEAYDARLREVDFLARQLDALLEGRSLEDLRATAGAGAADDDGAPIRPVADLAEDLAEARAEYRRLEDSLKATQKQIAGWTATYGSEDKVLDAVLESRAAHRELEKQIAGLKPLPEGIEDASAFIRHFKEREARWHELESGEMRDLLVRKAEIEGRAPQRPMSEIPEILDNAESVFTRTLREAEAIARISRRFEELRTEMDQATMDPWLHDLQDIMAPLSTNRYRALDFDSGLASNSDGLAIPFGSLSAGTRSCLGLALRLSMVRHFTRGRGGFLILDDPLVDLDPARQAAAAQMLQHFAETCQVIILTCHPAHAQLLGGHQISLPAPGQPEKAVAS